MQSYECWGKAVKEGKEALLWEKITPEEEKEGDAYMYDTHQLI